MNITNTEARALELLAAGRERYGLEMVKESEGELKLGSVYVILGRLEKKGFVKSRKQEEPTQVVPRRLYKITGAGSQVFRAYAAGQAAFSKALAGVK